MNTRIEAALMISTGALLAAVAQIGPALGEYFYEAIITTATPVVTETTPVWFGTPMDLDCKFNIRVLPCQDSVSAWTATNNATMISRDDRGGYTVSIVDGELRTIEAEGEYVLEEEGDTVRILDPDGDIAFETSRSNPTLGGRNVVFRSFDAPVALMERASLGAHLSPVDEAMAAQLGIEHCIVVDFVIPGSGADAGGLEQYDVIVALGNEPVDARLLTEIIGGLRPGDTVELELIRGGKRRSIEIELNSTPGVAPVFEGFSSGFGDISEFEEMRRMLESQMRMLESMRLHAPRPMHFPRTAPTPLLRHAPPVKNNRDTIDASEMAPRTKSRSVPA